METVPYSFKEGRWVFGTYILNPEQAVIAMNAQMGKDQIIDSSYARERHSLISRKPVHQQPTYSTGTCYKCRQPAVAAQPYVNYRCAEHLAKDLYEQIWEKSLFAITLVFNGDWAIEDQAIAQQRIAHGSFKVTPHGVGLKLTHKSTDLFIDNYTWEWRQEWRLIISCPKPLIHPDGILLGPYPGVLMGRAICYNSIRSDCLANSVKTLPWKQRWWHLTMPNWYEVQAGPDIGKLKIGRYCYGCDPETNRGLHWTQTLGLPQKLVELWKQEFGHYPEFLHMDLASQLKHLTGLLNGPRKPIGVTVTRESVIEGWKKLSEDKRWSKLDFGFQLRCVMVYPLAINGAIMRKKAPVVNLGRLEELMGMWESVEKDFWQQPIVMLYSKLMLLKLGKLQVYIPRSKIPDWIKE